MSKSGLDLQTRMTEDTAYQTRPAYVRTLDSLFSMLCAYALLGLVSGRLEFLRPGGAPLLSEELWLGVCSAVLFVLLASIFGPRLVQRPPGRAAVLRPFTPQVQPQPFVLGLFLLLISDAPASRYGFFPDGQGRLVIFYAGVLGVLLLSGLRRGTAATGWIDAVCSWPVLAFCQLATALSFLQYADGRFLFSDDHPSVIHRLNLLYRHFPNIPFYNTEWNAGYTTTDLLATGPLNILPAAYPFFRIAEIAGRDAAASYTSMVAFLFIGVVPAAVYAAARLLKFEKPVAVTAALLSLAPTSGFFEWLLKYGTLPFAFSAGLSPLALALALRLALDEEPPRWRHAAAMLLVGSLCVMWSLAAIVFVPITLYALVRYRQTFARDRAAKVAAFGAAFLLLNGLWVYTFAAEYDVLSFFRSSALVGAEANSPRMHPVSPAGQQDAAQVRDKQFTAEAQPVRPPASAGTKTIGSQISAAKKKFRENIIKFNPLLLFLSLPGFFLIRVRSTRTALGLTIVWLMFVAAVGEQFKPQLELKRMAIFAGFSMTILAGAAIVRVLSDFTAQRKTGTRASSAYRAITAGASCAVILGCLVFTPIQGAAAYINRSWEKFNFSPPIVRQLAGAIEEHGGAGRTFFFGFILHELGSSSWQAQDGGHVSILSSLTTKPLYASEFYHRYWHYVDPIPHEFLARKTAGVEEFLDLINATAVVTFSPEWEAYCRGQERYQEVFSSGRWRVFSRRTENPSYFLRGSGSLRIEQNEIAVRPDTAEVVLKFRYYPGLEVDDPSNASITPVPVYRQRVPDGKTGYDASYVLLKVSPQALEKKKEIRIGYHVG